MNNDFCPFELAVKLKEKGFPQRTFGEYDMQGACYVEDGRFYENGCITEAARAYTAPTISQVLKWLREQKKIYIVIAVTPTLSTKDKIAYYYQIYFNSTGVGSDYYESELLYAQWEECAIDSIKYVLENSFNYVYNTVFYKKKHS